MELHPPPKQCTSPCTLSGQKIGSPEYCVLWRLVFSRKVFDFLLDYCYFLFWKERGGGWWYFVWSQKPEPQGGTLFGRGYFIEAVLFGRGIHLVAFFSHGPYDS